MAYGDFLDFDRFGEDTPLLNRLLDREDTSPVVVPTSSGREIEYEQCALIPFEGRLYVLLHPITPIEGLEDDLVFIFRYEQTDTDERLTIEEDDAIGEQVYELYEGLFSED